MLYGFAGFFQHGQFSVTFADIRAYPAAPAAHRVPTRQVSGRCLNDPPAVASTCPVNTGMRLFRPAQHGQHSKPLPGQIDQPAHIYHNLILPDTDLSAPKCFKAPQALAFSAAQPPSSFWPPAAGAVALRHPPGKSPHTAKHGSVHPSGAVWDRPDQSAVPRP